MAAQLTQDQQRAFQLLQSQGNVFLSGAAGTGKSYVVKEFLKSVDRKVFPVLASTGAAAVLVGGRTFHSFFGLGILEGGAQATIERALKDRRVVQRLKKVDGFILDEVSMLSGPVLEVAEKIACMARNNDLFPWGGLKIIAVGDFAQLPPVQSNDRNKSWSFLSSIWARSRFQNYLLSENLRTSHEDFLLILQKIRQGYVDKDVEDFLESRKIPLDDHENVTRLYPRRDQTENFNETRLEQLEGNLIKIPSEYYGSTAFVERLKKQSPIGELLKIKIGCLVMFRQNDPQYRWVNGTTGTVIDMCDDQLIVKLLSSHRTVSVEKVSFSMVNAEGDPVAAVTNFPITLAYAATIHKAQGMTLDRVQVDLRSLWEPGQAYVALSRVTHPEGLYITGWDRQSIKADDRVKSFYNSLGQKEITASNEGYECSLSGLL